MGKGIKKHQKRLSAPSHWLLDKLSGMPHMCTARNCGCNENRLLDNGTDILQVPMPPRLRPVLTSSVTRCL